MTTARGKNRGEVFGEGVGKIVIAGGTGQLGEMLARHHHGQGREVVVLGRTPREVPWRFVRWDGASLGAWAEEVDGADVVVNLAGRSVDCRYHEENRRQIMASRVDSTRVVGEAIARAVRPPRVWLQASTATIYAHRYDGPNDEATGRLGGQEPGVPDTWRFSVEVARAWERSLGEAPTPLGVRKVAMRTAMVMSPDRGGVFDVLLRLVRAGLGGTMGDGRQYVSWIHHEDFVRALDWILARDHLAGAINLASPNPLPNREFMTALRRAWGARVGLPAASWMIELGTLFLRTESELVLKSRRVVPGILREDGFSFEHPEWPEAARQLVEAWRSGL